MPTMTESALKDGIIYGDNSTSEYVYMPASEIGIATPLCIFECKDEKSDITLQEALDLVRKLSLKPVIHPYLGNNSC